MALPGSLASDRPGSHLEPSSGGSSTRSPAGRSRRSCTTRRDEYGRDVFGLSPRGTAWTLAQATKEWERWKREGGYAKAPLNVPGARPVAKREVRGRADLQNFDLMPGDEGMIRKAIEAGRFPGFRRLNARGEKWKPGHGLGPTRRPPPAPPTAPGPAPAPQPKPKPSPMKPGNFQTHEHVNTFFAKTFPNATIETLEHIPVAVWNAHARELEILAREFPEVAHRLKKISASENGVNPHWYAAADAEKGSVLFLTPEHNQNLAVMAARDAKTVQEGWWPKGAEPSQSIMTHEWGHLVDAWIKQEGRGSGYTFIDPGAEKDGLWSDWYRLRQVFLKSGRNRTGEVDPIAAVSIYSRTSHKEAVAEAFNAMRWTPDDQKTNTLKKFEKVLKAAIAWIRKQPKP